MRGASYPGEGGWWAGQVKGRGKDGFRKGLSQEGTFEHRAGEGGTHAKLSEGVSMEEGRAEQRVLKRSQPGAFEEH